MGKKFFLNQTRQTRMRINLLSSAARCAATSRKFYQFVLNFRYCINFVIVVFSQLFACIFCPGQAVPTIVTFFDRFFAKAFHLFSATSLSVFGSLQWYSQLCSEPSRLCSEPC